MQLTLKYPLSASDCLYLSQRGLLVRSSCALASLPDGSDGVDTGVTPPALHTSSSKPQAWGTNDV